MYRDGLCVALIIIDYVCVAYQMRCALFYYTLRINVSPLRTIYN